MVNIHSHIFAIRRAYSRRFHPKIVLMSGEIKLKMSMKYRCEQVDEGSRCGQSGFWDINPYV